jgi:hypothetical protein
MAAISDRRAWFTALVELNTRATSGSNTTATTLPHKREANRFGRDFK